MAAAIVAAVAALAGVFLQSLIGDRRARLERERREFVAAVRAAQAAFVGFREQQYLKISDRRQGIPDTRETRQARYGARSAFTTAIDQLYTATAERQVLDLVDEAWRVAIALGVAAPAGGPVDETAVTELGEQARQIHTALRNAAHHALHG
ncbi:hypothetical protein OG601_47265 [Streptomyces sp. NBC_01239]|uniref:hypothetical protein n=1 Tax=Streptomyces sp. NBC_01239 TaxID=2903792 RepID=UPI0022546989|nr:hypothetical protein [Streptomyces sp. NBC_01239]MCX4809007.1 hypothetical protein [Streptomyces sp. NBC_01239]MCX4816727.1 hypothetical protein [Streptomyces sp. NBC_01239]MCX4818175.1 hypothetical protein [Streptomyces sp. NBC_01239]